MNTQKISKRFSRRSLGAYQKGVTMIEYALIAALISIIAIAAIRTSGASINAIWTNIANAVNI